MKNRRPFIAGNWKMHLTAAEARGLASAIVQAGPELREAEIVIAPPFTALNEVRKVIDGSSVRLAAQNLFWEEKGAFTGEVSGPMLKDAGCGYVIIGHSERRQFFKESDADVNKKIEAALRFALCPIVCIGESLEERERAETMKKISLQVDGGLNGIDAVALGLGDIIIAYEPIWAIGTGKTATPAQAEEVHAFIREKLALKYGNDLATCAIILYGGSVKPANSYALLSEKNIDGFLVGGASLESESFIRITREAIKAYKEKK
jgi:triosephosphate isomerase